MKNCGVKNGDVYDFDVSVVWVLFVLLGLLLSVKEKNANNNGWWKGWWNSMLLIMGLEMMSLNVKLCIVVFCFCFYQVCYGERGKVNVELRARFQGATSRYIY